MINETNRTSDKIKKKLIKLKMKKKSAFTMGNVSVTCYIN